MSRWKRKKKCGTIFRNYGKIMKDVTYIFWKLQKRERDTRNSWKNKAQAFFKINDRHQTTDHNKLQKIPKKMGIPDQITVSEKSVYRSRSNS